MYDAEIVATRMLTPRVRELTITPSSGFEFDPGQWVSVRFPIEDDKGKPLRRSYSISSAPRADGKFELAITRVDGGPGSSYLHDIGEGDELTISRAQGMFEMPDSQRSLLMVAAGTGVAPFRSMLQAIAAGAPAPPAITLLLGVRTVDDLLYLDEFEGLHDTIPGFRLVPTLSQAQASWTGRRGRVQSHVAELVAGYGGECELLVCGVGEMVKEVRKLAREELGLGRDQVKSERFN
jgi:CDP-4-dehydro-6-deoxyglucose reductase